VEILPWVIGDATELIVVPTHSVVSHK